jgi:hypothetical protein
MYYLQDGIMRRSTFPDVKSGIHFGTEGFFGKQVITVFFRFIVVLSFLSSHNNIASFMIKLLLSRSISN